LIPVESIRVVGDESRESGFSADRSFQTPSDSGAIDREHHPTLGVKGDLVEGGRKLRKFHGSKGICLYVHLCIEGQIGVSNVLVLVAIDMFEHGEVREAVHQVVDRDDCIPF
jgi:hypothetical protein